MHLASDFQARQLPQMRLFVAAAGSYSVGGVLIAFGVWTGAFPLRMFVWYAILSVLINGAIFAIFRSGLHRRFQDPSLTTAQILLACALGLYVAYEAGEFRGSVMTWLLVAFMFGLFRLGTRALMNLAAIVMGGYAALIALLYFQDPQGISLKREILQWFVAAATFAGFAVLGGYVSKLREKARGNAERFRSLSESLEQRVGERTGELRAAIAELEAFNYAISHDLRLPLGAINSFAQLLRMKEGGRLTEDGRKLLGFVESNATRMAGLVDGLLEFAQLGRREALRRAVRMDELASDVLRELQAESRTSVSVRTLPDCDGDAVLLRRIWVNLVGNALKYTRGRQPATIEIGFDEAPRAYWVRDNGVGFEMAHAEKIFGVFERLHSEEEFEGLGLGLAIVDRIVRRHGGRVWAKGVPDGGATFYFSL